MRGDQKISFFVGCLVLLLIGSLNLNLAENRLQKVYAIELLPLDTLPVKKTVGVPVKVAIAEETFPLNDRVFPAQDVWEPQITAQSVYILDLDSGTPLYQRNAQNSFSVASTAKLMTAVVALETFKMDQELVVKQSQTIEGSSGLLIVGDVLSVEQLLQLLLIQSANDAAIVLAANHPLGLEGFVADMNKKAQVLYLTGTHFNNPVGFDNSLQYSTARDLAILSQYATNIDIIKRTVAKQHEIVTNKNKTARYDIYNTNALMIDPRVVGVKTGTTTNAGEVLISQLEFEGRNLLFVVVGSSNRYTDTLQLIDWVFSWFEWQKYSSNIGEAGQIRP